MSAETRVAELEREVDHLMEEVERYRSAAEDAIQQLDWCIGYFAGSHKGALARSCGDVAHRKLRSSASPHAICDASAS